MVKKLTKDIASFGGAGMFMGTLSVVGGKAGIDTGIQHVSPMMPMIGTTMMAGHAARLATKNIKKIKKELKF
ncbi:unnamed protein product [marine sediment metagenome]|uniref:Uncharacterized protein n=1 Tax=marine sediment metagenome TaxID=412755 RepID=X0VHK5_9ZZZZ